MDNLSNAFACYNRREDVRKDSTSGGIFSLIGEYVIKELNGIVVGAIFDDKYNVVHECTDSISGLEKMRGSKYPESDMVDCYRKIREYLKQGRYVFFTGTPCQVAGVKMFLQKEYTNLLTMDFVCHGIASPGMWSDYLQHIGGNNIQYVRFKDKEKSWKSWYLKIVSDKKTFYQRGRVNKFMKSYLQYANIRPACYECRFKGDNRYSDFTISDCWGIGERDKTINDDKGLSALILNSERSKEIFKIISKDLIYKAYDRDTLMSENWTYYKCVTKHKNRDEFFKLWQEKGIKKALDRYFSPGLDGWLYYIYLKLIGREK